MRVVVDTNVLVSGIYFSGPPGKVLDAWADGRFEIVATPEILDEYVRVVDRLRARYPAVDPLPIVDRILRDCHLFESVPIDARLCDDPADLRFLAGALAARADGVISGDRDLLRAASPAGVRVWRPREFLELLT